MDTIAIVRLSNNILVVTRLGRRILKDREISRAWYGVDEHRGIDCTQEVQQLVNGGSTVRAENGLVSYDPAPFTRKVLKIFFEVEVEEGSSWTRRRGRRWSSMRSRRRRWRSRRRRRLMCRSIVPNRCLTSWR